MLTAFRASIEELKKERDDLQKQIMDTRAKAEEARAAKANSDDYNGYKAIKEHEAFEEKIISKSEAKVKHWQALIDATKKNIAVHTNHEKTDTKKAVFTAMMVSLRRAEDKGQISREMVDEELDLLREMSKKSQKRYQATF